MTALQQHLERVSSAAYRISSLHRLALQAGTACNAEEYLEVEQVLVPELIDAVGALEQVIWRNIELPAPPSY